MISVTPSFDLGIDIGSTAIKAVLVHSGTDDPIWHRYARHESRPAEKLLEVLRALEAETPAGPGNCRAYATGSGAPPLAAVIGARAVQEIAATVLAVERRHPAARTIVELGGQDAKIVVLEPEGGATRKSVSMNDKCAGGTGAVIDKIAAKLGLGASDLAALRYAGCTLHPIAGKCGVFAETDINSLQKRGVRADELMASLFEAIVVQNLAVLARGQALQPEVVLLGGPHAFLPALCDAWTVHLARLWRERAPDGDADGTRRAWAPPLAAHFGALGAIALGRLEADGSADYAGASRLAERLGGATQLRVRVGAPAIAHVGMAMDAFRSAYDTPPWLPPAFDAGAQVPAFVGLDAGSTSTKAVALDEHGTVLAKAYQLSRGNPIEDGREVLRALRESVAGRGATLSVRGLVTTGYAKDTLRDVFAADGALVETVAHAQSALQLYDDPHVVVDVGGQDIKIVVLRNGRVKDFRLNTQCSAGNGYFLQAIAGRFGYPVETFAEAAFSAREMPVFGHGCVLFLQSEIADVQRRGWRPEEVLAGLAAVLPKNVFLYVAKAPNLARLGRRFVLQGGTQRNLAAVKAQVDFIRASFHGRHEEPSIVLHRHAGEAGAIGAGLEAIRLWRDGRRTTFIGLDAVEAIRYRARSGEDTRCRYCTNECLRTFIDIWSHASAAEERAPERRLIVATCEKGAAADVASMRGVQSAIEAVKTRTPNLVALAAREVWRPPEVPNVAYSGHRSGWTRAARERESRRAARGDLVVGIPRVFNMYAFAPLFAGYLQALGVGASHIVYSRFTSLDMYRDGTGRGAIDPCYPSKVALAHVHDLLKERRGRAVPGVLFFPMIDVMPMQCATARGSHACPTVTLTPQTVRASFTRDRDEFAARGVRYVDPFLDLDDRRLFERQMFEAWDPVLGLEEGEHRRAVACGFDALERYEARIRRAAREALDALAREDRIGIVVLGRVYHHDPGLNHGIPEDLQKLGYPVFSQSTLPRDEDLLERLFGDEVRAGVIAHPLDVTDVWKNAYSASSNLKLWAAKFAARHPNLAAVELSSFKCGHDATIYATVEEIVEASGTPYFGFKDLDENRPAGAIALRLETLDYALKRRREHVAARRRTAERVERTVARYERRIRSAARSERERAPAPACAEG